MGIMRELRGAIDRFASVRITRILVDDVRYAQLLAEMRDVGQQPIPGVQEFCGIPLVINDDVNRWAMEVGAVERETPT